MNKEKTLKELTEDLLLRDEELRISEEKFRTLFCVNKTPILIYSLEDNLIKNVNKSFADASGYSEEELISTNGSFLYFIPDTRLDVIKYVKEFGFIENFAVTLKRKDGRIIPCLFSTQPLVKDQVSIFVSVIEV